MTIETNEINRLKNENKKLQMLNAELENGILYLTKQLEKEVRKSAIDKIMLQHYGQMFSASAANLLLDPNPVELQCSGSKTGTTRNYVVQIKNIVAIKSDGRLKNITLKKAIRAIEGDAPSKVLHYNNNQVDWDGLLFLLQRKGEFLFRVQKSHAINIYDYTLQDNNTFHITKDLESAVDEELHVIVTDSFFDKTAYYRRLAEINYLYNTQLGFQIHLQKLQEISDYIKTLDVTNEGEERA